MDEILRLRFLERDKTFSSKLEEVKRNASVRGISGNAIEEGYAVLLDEYVESRVAIVGAIAEGFRIDRPNKIDQNIQTQAKDILRTRKHVLEQLFADRMKVITSHMMNEKMYSQYATLNGVADLHDKELEREIDQEIANYLTSRGATLLDRVKNQLMDRPLVVVIVITASAVTTVLAFLVAVGVVE